MLQKIIIKYFFSLTFCSKETPDFQYIVEIKFSASFFIHSHFQYWQLVRESGLLCACVRACVCVSVSACMCVCVRACGQKNVRKCNSTWVCVCVRECARAKKFLVQITEKRMTQQGARIRQRGP